MLFNQFELDNEYFLEEDFSGLKEKHMHLAIDAGRILIWPDYPEN